MEIAGHLAFDEGLSDLTGFEQDGREFAVVGLIDTVAAAFVDITDPGNPVEVDRQLETLTNKVLYVGNYSVDWDA